MDSPYHGTIPPEDAYPEGYQKKEKKKFQGYPLESGGTTYHSPPNWFNPWPVVCPGLESAM
jgi:hypothetical protein